MTDDDETIALRATVVDGNGYPDDYQVVWRGLLIGRIMKATGSPNVAPQWCGNATSTANRRSAAEGGPVLISPIARLSSRQHGPGFAVNSQKMTSRRLIATSRPDRTRPPDMTGSVENEVQRESAVRKPRGRR